MTEATWKEILKLFDENEQRLEKLAPAKPLPTAKFWRESAHGTLGHLTACQAAWLPIMQQLRDGKTKGVLAIRPDPLYTKLGFSTMPWQDILKQFKKERAEWRGILRDIDVTRQIQTTRRELSAQTLTKRLVDHEKRHLDTLGSK